MQRWSTNATDQSQQTALTGNSIPYSSKRPGSPPNRSAGPTRSSAHLHPPECVEQISGWERLQHTRRSITFDGSITIWNWTRSILITPNGSGREQWMKQQWHARRWRWTKNSRQTSSTYTFLLSAARATISPAVPEGGEQMRFCATTTHNNCVIGHTNNEIPGDKYMSGESTQTKNEHSDPNNWY